MAYVVNMIEGVLGLGAIPVLVFDGDRYPPKLATQQGRRDDAANAEREARAAISGSGGPSGAALAKLWRQAATVKEPLVRELMQWCVDRDVEFIVAPYEADQQLERLQSQ